MLNKKVEKLVFKRAKRSGVEEVKKSGIEEDKKAAQLSIIQNLLNSGMKIDEISKITGLTQEEINDLLDNKNIHRHNN